MEKPFIIPIFIPQEGCPHHCVFCNQEKITGVSPRLPSFSEIESEVNTFLSYTETPPGLVQVAFYGGNFLGLKKDIIRHFIDICEKLAETGKIHGLRFSTRPDTITRDKLEIIRGSLGTTIEIGVQSMDDDVLFASRRGHSASDTRQAVALLKSCGYKVGLQMMVGLPEDTDEKAMTTACEIVKLSPDFVRVYPTVVLGNSILGKWYEKGKYHPLPLESCVSLVKRIFLLFNTHGIPVIRMGLQPTEELNKTGSILAGPFHPSFGQLVYSEIVLDHLTDILESDTSGTSTLSIEVHLKNISTVRGLKNRNLKILKEKFQLTDISVSADRSIAENMMKINGTVKELWKNPSSYRSTMALESSNPLPK